MIEWMNESVSEWVNEYNDDDKTIKFYNPIKGVSSRHKIQK